MSSEPPAPRVPPAEKFDEDDDWNGRIEMPHPDVIPDDVGLETYETDPDKEGPFVVDGQTYDTRIEAEEAYIGSNDEATMKEVIF